MKFFYSFLFSWILLISCGCNVKGQHDKSNTPSPPLTNTSDSKNTLEKNVVPDSSNKGPITDAVKIIPPGNGAESSFKERQQLRENFKWGDTCNFDLEKKEDDDAGRVWGTFVNPDKYLIEVYCNSLGAYNSNYLTYLFDVHTKEAALLSYEYFERENNKRFKKTITSKPIGFSIDPKTKVITLVNKYYGAGQCGWDASYKIVNNKPVLIGMRAEWNCDPGTDYEKWPKLNLNTLRKK